MVALAAVFLLLHGLVHAIMFGLAQVPQARADMGFDPARSWLLGDARMFGLLLAIAIWKTQAAS